MCSSLPSSSPSFVILIGAANKAEMERLEREILRILSQSGGGTILENEKAVQDLNEAKSNVEDITSKEKRGAEAQEKMQDAREEYRPIAALAQALFFCVAELASLDASYVFSLPWFYGLLLKSIKEAGRSDSVSKR